MDLAFENGIDGGRLFVTDSNQATHAARQNNSSRIVVIDPETQLCAQWAVARVFSGLRPD